MQNDLLNVVVAIANPIRWQSRIKLYKEFEQNMLDSGVKLTLVECAYGERPFELEGNKNINYIPVRAKTLVWSKENLINIGIQRLPPDWQYVAWVDGDIKFRKASWAAETVHALQLYDWVQPWADCYDLGPNDEHLQAHSSFGKIYAEGRPINPAGNESTFAHPGYAWAATRRAINLVGGLIETAALGAGDHHMALAHLGRVRESVPGGISEAYLRPLVIWQERCLKHINGNISYVPGTIEHSWHGPKKKRAYIERWNIVTKNNFNPETDLIKNEFGVLELAGNKPQLKIDIDRYFRSRAEDSNYLGDD